MSFNKKEFSIKKQTKKPNKKTSNKCFFKRKFDVKEKKE